MAKRHWLSAETLLPEPIFYYRSAIFRTHAVKHQPKLNLKNGKQEMDPRFRVVVKLLILVLVVVLLCLIFPPVLGFVELAAREIRYMWWIVLLLALAIWMIWGLGRKKD